MRHSLMDKKQLQSRLGLRDMVRIPEWLQIPGLRMLSFRRDHRPGPFEPVFLSEYEQVRREVP
jgi:hypothetical protein